MGAQRLRRSEADLYLKNSAPNFVGKNAPEN
jgi:hypothetical protein